MKQCNTGKECINNGTTKMIRKSKLIYKRKKLKFLFLFRVTCFRWTISELASKVWDWWIWSTEVAGTHPRVVGRHEKRALVARLSHNSSRLLEGGNPKKVDGNPLTSLSRLTKAVKGHLRNFSVYLVGNKRPCFQRPLNLSTLNWNFASYRQRKCQPYRSQNTDYARSVFSKASFTPLPLSQSHQGNSIKWGIASSEDRIFMKRQSD